MEKEHKKEDSEKRATKHTHRKKEKIITKPIIALIAITALLIIFNQFQISSVARMITSGVGKSSGAGAGAITLSGEKDLANIDLSSLKSTGHTVAAVFPVENIKTSEDAIAIMLPTGTPDYGEAMGVSFDEPVESMEAMARAYPALKKQAQENPEVWQRYLNLALKPVGITCEYCCGVGNIGIDKNGNLKCGCQHIPALHTVTLWLMLNTDYSDGEILREVMRWKTLFFPKNMIELGMTVAGGDTSTLNNLPGMVGGC